jgi:glutamine synthetase
MAITGTTENKAALGPSATVEDVMARIESRHLRWVELYYTDVIGGYNHVHIPARALEADAFTDGVPKLDRPSGGSGRSSSRT